MKRRLLKRHRSTVADLGARWVSRQDLELVVNGRLRSFAFSARCQTKQRLKSWGEGSRPRKTGD